MDFKAIGLIEVDSSSKSWLSHVDTSIQDTPIRQNTEVGLLDRYSDIEIASDIWDRPGVVGASRSQCSKDLYPCPPSRAFRCPQSA